MIIPKDRVKQYTSTAGSGDITFSRSFTGYQAFADAFSSGESTYYCIENRGAWEVGLGTYGVSGPNTLSRDTILASSTGSKLTLNGGSTVFCTLPASKILVNQITSPASGEVLMYNGSQWVNSSTTGYTNEQAQDAVASMIVPTGNITTSYNDVANVFTISGTGLLARENNLSDLVSASVARSNLGLGSAALSNSGDFYLSTNPSGYITASAVGSGYQPLDGDLSSLSAATGVNTIYYRSTTNTWSPVVIGTGISFSGGTLSNTLDLSSYATSSGVAASYVPYTGATGAVNLGSQSLTAGAITASGQFTNALGTITTSAPLTLTQTWNAGGVTFNSMLINITDTASASLSLFADWQVGGVTKFSVDKRGYGTFVLGLEGQDWIRVTSNTAGFSIGTNSDVQLYRDAADTLAQRRSTNAQTFNIANTYASSTSYEYGTLKWNSNELRIGTTVGSAGGTQRALVFGQTNAAGTFTHQMSIAPTQNCVQIGVQNTSYYPTRLMVSTDNTSTTIGGASVSDQGIYVTNSTNTINRPVGLQIGGYGGWAHCGIFGVMTNTGGNTGGDILLAMRLNAYSAGSLSSVARWYGPTGKVVFSGSADGTGSSTTDTQFTFTVPNHTNQITTVESPDVLFTLGSKTWAAGAITTQRFFRITAPTANFASASTITTASTLSIGGAPIAGTNATITNAYALNVESGNSYFAGGIRFGTTDGTNAGYLNIADRCSILATGYNCLAFSFGSMLGWHAVWGSSGLQLNSRTQGFGWGTTYANQVVFDAALYSPAVNVIEQRLGTNAQTFRVYNTYTSSTNAEWFQQSWSSNEARLGTAIGSTGGTQRNLILGAWDSTGTFSPKVVIQPTSTGAIYFESATAGTTRGQYGIDLQLYRSASSQIASDYGVTIGTQCTASGGTGSVAIGRNVSVADSLGGAVGIGRNITITGYRAVGIGNGVTAVSDSLALGLASYAAHSSAICLMGSVSRWAGQIIWAGSSAAEGVFGASYNIPYVGTYTGGLEQATIAVRTTSNTLTTLQSIAVGTGYTTGNRQKHKSVLYYGDFVITAMRSDGACAKFARRVLVKSLADAAGSTYTFSVLQSETIGTDINEISGSAISFATTASTQTVDIQVQGESSYACTGVSATNIITAVGHPYANDDIIVFLTLTGGSSLQANPSGQYYLATYKVINVSGNTFQIATPGSSTTPLALGSDISAGTVSRPIIWTKVSGKFAVVTSGY